MAEENPKAFRFWNGKDHVYLDPSETRRKLIHSLGGKYLQIIADYEAGIDRAPGGDPNAEPVIDPDLEPVRNQATEHIVMASREVFELPPIDRKTGTGVEEDDAIAVFWSFLEFSEDAKKKRVASPTDLPCTAPLSSPSLSTPTPSLVSTSTSSAYGSSQQSP